MATFLFFLGLLILFFGAELLVRGASRLGIAIGISPLVVGLTIVAFGTSSPELAVGVKASLRNLPDITIGTCIGSTIFNILFILGVSSIITPLKVSQQLVWFEVPIMIGAHLLLFLMCLDGKIDKLDALILFSCIIVYTLYAIRKSYQERKTIEEEYRSALDGTEKGSKLLTISKQLFLVATGLAFCVLGAGWMLDSAVILARKLGVSELIIGITIIGASTSLPEVATSVTAAIKGQKDIAIGNVVGSNIFNCLAIIGLTGLIAPNGISIAPSVIRFDLPVAIAACIACLPIFFTGHKISRWEGFCFLGYYAAYVSYLILSAQGHDALPMFSMIMLLFVIPLTALTFAVVIFREWRGNRSTNC